jgi:hypothetical protein
MTFAAAPKPFPVSRRTDSQSPVSWHIYGPAPPQRDALDLVPRARVVDVSMEGAISSPANTRYLPKLHAAACSSPSNLLIYIETYFSRMTLFLLD